MPPSGPPAGFGGAPGGPAPTSATSGAGTADSGTVTNAQGSDTTITTTSSSGIGADGLGADASITPDSGQLPNTGGEPVLMSLVGLSMALGAFAIRKRVSA